MKVSVIKFVTPAFSGFALPRSTVRSLMIISLIWGFAPHAIAAPIPTPTTSFLQTLQGPTPTPSLSPGGWSGTYFMPGERTYYLLDVEKVFYRELKPGETLSKDDSPRAITIESRTFVLAKGAEKLFDEIASVPDHSIHFVADSQSLGSQLVGHFQNFTATKAASGEPAFNSVHSLEFVSQGLLQEFENFPFPPRPGANFPNSGLIILTELSRIETKVRPGLEPWVCQPTNSPKKINDLRVATTKAVDAFHYGSQSLAQSCREMLKIEPARRVKAAQKLDAEPWVPFLKRKDDARKKTLQFATQCSQKMSCGWNRYASLQQLGQDLQRIFSVIDYSFWNYSSQLQRFETEAVMKEQDTVFKKELAQEKEKLLRLVDELQCKEMGQLAQKLPAQKDAVKKRLTEILDEVRDAKDSSWRQLSPILSKTATQAVQGKEHAPGDELLRYIDNDPTVQELFRVWEVFPDQVLAKVIETSPHRKGQTQHLYREYPKALTEAIWQRIRNISQSSAINDSENDSSLWQAFFRSLQSHLRTELDCQGKAVSNSDREKCVKNWLSSLPTMLHRGLFDRVLEEKRYSSRNQLKTVENLALRSAGVSRAFKFLFRMK